MTTTSLRGRTSRILRGFLRREAAPPDARVYAILSEIDQAIQVPLALSAFLPLLDRSKESLLVHLTPHYASPVEAKAVIIKILNLCAAKYHLRARSVGLLSRPFGLNIDPSNACNLACPGCVHSSHVKELKLFDWDKKILSEDRLAAFLNRYGPTAIHTVFCNYGEPLINPDTPRLIRLAKRYLIQSMTSTSLSLGRFDAEAYVESGLDYMIVSIDGATQSVYQMFRKNGQLALVLDNIRKLVEARKKLKRQTPVIAWRFLTFRHNVHEIPMALEKARELQVDQFLTSPPYDVSWDDPAILPAQPEPVNVLFNNRAEAAVLANWNPFADSLETDALERDFERRWSDGIDGPHPVAVETGPTCKWLYKSMTLDAGGRIFPCCAPPEPAKDLIFAQAGDEPPGDLYNSDKYRLARQSFAHPREYRRKIEARGLAHGPHCGSCEWDKDHVTTEGTQIKVFLKSAGGQLFNGASMDILTSW